jgi:hypothetical protein
MPKGGRQPGAGRPKGTKNPATIQKEAAREALRQIVLRDMERLVKAQMDSAVGIHHFILRDPKTGKFERVTDEDRIVEALNAEGAEEGKTYYIHTKDPSTQAFTDLMNRALDKPKEQEQEIKVSGSVDIVSRLLAARKRLAAK